MIHDLDRLQTLARADDPDAAHALALAASRQQQRSALLYAGHRLATLADSPNLPHRQQRARALLIAWLDLLTDADRRALTIHAVYDSPAIADVQRYALNEPLPVSPTPLIEMGVLRQVHAWFDVDHFPERRNPRRADSLASLAMQWTRVDSSALRHLLRSRRHNAHVVRATLFRTLHQKHIFVAARPDVIAQRHGHHETTLEGAVGDAHFGFKNSWVLRQSLTLLSHQPDLLNAALTQRLIQLLDVNDEAYRACRRARRERTQRVVVEVLMPTIDQLPTPLQQTLMRFGHGEDYRVVVETLVDHFAHHRGPARDDTETTLQQLLRTSRGSTLRLLLDVLTRRFDVLSPALQHLVLDQSRVTGPRESLLRVLLDHLTTMHPETAHLARTMIARELEALDRGQPSQLFCQALSDHLTQRLPTQRVNPLVAGRVASVLRRFASHPHVDVRMLAARIWSGRSSNPFPELDAVYQQLVTDDHPLVKAALGRAATG